MKRSFAFVTVAAAIAFSAPAMAQDSVGPVQTDEKVNQLYVYGDDECPESTDDVITVCARLDEGDRYRIPKGLRSDPNDPSKEAWSRRVLAYEYVGREGTMSCSATGAGGFTGCGLSAIDQAYAEKAQDPGKLFGRLIAQKRRERLDQIDAEAREVEERVKEYEAEKVEREAKEAEARERADAADAAASEPLPEPQ